ncbi:type II secretion system F family protein [Paratractidigestivibacter sp.]|uniref:type II secretion system F family protein n=1 Tax=Paratractidigestivibacter sp. TaxID=2847316 RepID=UPI002ABD2B5A|nr:type II secretion system F family protein [Paratractidigestivibacter sp.]
MSAATLALAVGAALSAGCACAAFLRGDGRDLLRRDRLDELARAVVSSDAVRRIKEGEAKARAKKQCAELMPVMIDVVTLGLAAGLSFDASLALYCERYDDALAEALSQAMLSWRVGAATRGEALEKAARDLGLESLSRFGSVVCEALAFGSPLAESLERQAQVIRDEQRSRVEEEIERVPVKMLIPLGTLIVPAMLLAILGPLLGSALVLG